MKQPSTKKRKSITVISAVALALVLALSGTFAWQSLNQKALNENAQTVNPGGRMHDDFDGSNKDVYAENFGEEDLVVRVQLREYMEVGLDAGKNKTELNANRKVEAVQEGTEISKPNEWPVHKPTADAASCEGKVHEKMNWTMGGKTVYMPTFNKNQDSLKTDINGTFEKNFADYHKYTLNETKVADEIYDADNNTVEEEVPVEGTNITTKTDQTHTAKETINGTVMTMEAWKAAGSKPGDYWVYDKDGWAYWANPLKPGTATGLLLDQVELSQVMDDSWYYGIKVIGQFATMDDLGKDNQTGFYKDGTAPTAEAEELLKAIGAESSVPPIEYTVSVSPETAKVIKGKTQEFTATVTASDKSTPSQDVTWSVEGAKSTSTKFTGSTLTVGADESAKTLTVKATSTLGKGAVGEATVTVEEDNTLPSNISSDIKNKVQSGSGDPSKYVTIDGTDFYVLNVDNQKNQALLLARYAEKDGKPFNTDYNTEPGNNQWQGSEIQKRMQTYLKDKPTLSKAAVTVTLNTLGEFDGSRPRVESKDKVFLLSEADVFGSHTGTSAPGVTQQDYTLGKTGSVVPVNLRNATNKQGESVWWWLRSPHFNYVYVAAVGYDGAVNYNTCYDIGIAVRPALVVNL